MSAAHRHLACLATVALCDLSKAENHHKTIAFRHSSNQLSEFLLPQMCQQYDDSSAQLSSRPRGLNDIFGYPYPCVYWLDPHSVCCALSTPKTIYMIMMTYTAHRPELTIVVYGPWLVTCCIHLILPLWEISCQCQAMCCSIPGPEDTALTLKLASLGNTNLNDFHSSFP